MRRRWMLVIALLAWGIAITAPWKRPPRAAAPLPVACRARSPLTSSERSPPASSDRSPLASSDPDPRTESLYLIGDAGAPGPGARVLGALSRDAAERVARLGREHVAIVFLGDNIYPSGLPPADAADRARGERRLEAQIAAARRAGARAVFVPGNHDWENGGAGGWQAIQRQSRFVAARSGGAAEVVPADGCPGPVRRPLGDHLALVFLDTQWWLESGPRPSGPDAPCPHRSARAVREALAAAVRGPADGATGVGVHTIVMAHHPLATGGPHGGAFGWLDHVFPLRNVDRFLWIPLPFLGSLYPVARHFGVSPQDLPSRRNRAMRAAIEDALRSAPPLLYAAGHDHGLQVIEGDAAARYLLVSGAGSPRQITWVRPVAGTLFARAEPGYARLDVHATGAVELRIETVPAEGPPQESFSACLTP